MARPSAATMRSFSVRSSGFAQSGQSSTRSSGHTQSGRRSSLAEERPFANLPARHEERLSRDRAASIQPSATALVDSQEESPEQEAPEEESSVSDLEPEEMEEEIFDGVLNEEITASALHKLGRTASGTEHVYLYLSLANQYLSDITILSKYIHLEKLDVSYNKVSDLSCVSHMPYLLELDASHNELVTYFEFIPPKNLQVANFSYNKIPAMQDLSAYQSLTKLILDDNDITEIRGLKNCHKLTYLSLSNNQIKAITGLQHLPIKTLCLKANQIEKAVGLEELKVLQILDLSGNQIKSLEGLEQHSLLEDINLEDNQVSELSELEYIESLPLLRVLNLLKNPVQEHPDYWFLAIFMLHRLTELDHKKISVQEKVAAVNKYDPPPEVVAAQDHMTHVVYSMMQPQLLFHSTLPCLDAPYPMLVLTGPLACGKRELCHRLCRKFNNYFRYCPCHTTRGPYFGEENRLDYYFISQDEFDKLVNMGKFIATFKYNGFSYGLGRDTIESIAREGLATCVHLEMEGVRSLKNSYFEPRYILLTPVNKGKYGGHLRRMGLFSRREIDEALCRVDMYIRKNLDFPGFFDAVISIDDYDDAFSKLSHLVEEFLGLTQPLESKTSGGTLDLSISSSFPVQDKAASATLTVAGVKGTDGVAPSPTSNEFSDSSARNYSARISDLLSAQQKTELEEASLRRRQLVARQGLMGKAISSYSQLFQRDADIAGAQPWLCEPPPIASKRASRYGLSPDGRVPPTSPDHSYREMDQSLPDPSGVSVPGAPSALPPGAASVPVLMVSDESGGKQEPESAAESKGRRLSKQKPTSPRVTQAMIRPGSNTRPVLPPIPSGRKNPKATTEPLLVGGQQMSVASAVASCPLE